MGVAGLAVLQRSPKLVELFDAHGVSFVSVTQQFLRVNYCLEKEGPFDPGEMILSGSIP